MGLIIKFVEHEIPVKGFYKCNYCNPDAVEKVVRYILRKDGRKKNKVLPGEFDIFGSIGTCHKDIKGIIDDFSKTKEIFGKTGGVQIKHLIISFNKQPKITPKKLGKFVIKTLKYYSQKYQVVYAVHEDTENLHIHVGINSVSIYGDKFSVRAEDMRAFRKRTEKIFKECF